MTTDAIATALLQAPPEALSHTIKMAVNTQLTASKTPVMVDGVARPPPPQQLAIMELNWGHLATTAIEAETIVCKKGDRVRFSFGYDAPNFLDFAIWKVQTEADYVQCNTRNSTAYARERAGIEGAIKAGLWKGPPLFPDELMPVPIIWPKTFAARWEFRCDDAGLHFFVGEGRYCHKGRAQARRTRELAGRTSGRGQADKNLLERFQTGVMA